MQKIQQLIQWTTTKQTEQQQQQIMIANIDETNK